jgi:hypothetical protein
VLLLTVELDELSEELELVSGKPVDSLELDELELELLEELELLDWLLVLLLTVLLLELDDELEL